MSSTAQPHGMISLCPAVTDSAVRTLVCACVCVCILHLSLCLSLSLSVYLSVYLCCRVQARPTSTPYSLLQLSEFGSLFLLDRLGLLVLECALLGLAECDVHYHLCPGFFLRLDLHTSLFDVLESSRGVCV